MKMTWNVEKLLIRKFRFKASAELDSRVHGDIANALDKSEEQRLTTIKPNVWRTILKGRIARLAAAAVIVIVVLAGVHQIGGPGVALADVLERVEQAHVFMYKVKMTVTGRMMGDTPARDMEQQGTNIVSTDYGMKMEMTLTDPNSGEQTTQQIYVLPEEKAMFMIMLDRERYARMEFDDNLLAKMKQQSNDPREMIKQILNCQYTELGPSVIDGVKVEGFQTTDPAFYGGAMGESVKVSLWVDVETRLPVLTQMDLKIDEHIRVKGVVYDYQWDIPVDRAEFEPVIPENFEPFLTADSIKVPSPSQEGAVEGLKLFVEFSGKYPNTLNMTTLMQQVDELRDSVSAVAEQFRQKLKQAESEEKRMETLIEVMRPVQALRMFYAGLVAEHKDPAYYGDKVNSEFPHAVLMRWKIEDDMYRIIFADLTVGEATAEELAELEAMPLNLDPYPINPDPADGTVGTELKGLKLSWMLAAYATKHKVYFGTSAEKMSLLTVVEGSSYDKLPVLRRDTTYYWRVDAVHADGSIETGDVWSFNTGKLVGWWKLDDGSGNTAADAGDKGLDGTLVGDTSWVDGIVAGALVFDGDGDYVDVGKDPAFDITNQITVSAWIKVDAFDRDWQSIVTKGDSAWRLQRNRNNNTLEFACDSLVVPGTRWGSVHGTADVKDGWWHYIAGTYDGSQICLYVDGKLDVSSTASGTIKINDQPVYIGENSEMPNRFWNGLIDDVRIYSYALSADEVAELEAALLNDKPTAIRPQPADGAPVAVFADVELSWMQGAYVNEHKVYFGTAADQLTLLAEVTESCSVIAPALEKATTYYWCVDEVQPDGSVAAGDVWSFNTGKLVGWWKFDGDAYDSSGSRNHGTIIGEPNLVTGKVEGAPHFDGIDDYIRTGYATDLPAWTVAIWVKSPAAPKKGPPSGPVHRENNFQISWNHTSADFSGAAAMRAINQWYAASFGELQANKWYHLAATYDGENLKAYTNGVLITDNPDPSGPPDKESATLKFAKHTNYGDHFEGTLDDICIYSYDLTADEVAALYEDSLAASVAEER